MVIWRENTSAKKRSLSEAMQVKVGDRIEFDANPNGYTPRIHSGVVVGFSKSMASHGNPGANHFKVKCDNGTIFFAIEWSVTKVNGKPVEGE